MPRLGHYGILAAAFVLTALAGTANAENAWNNYHWARTTNYFVLQTVDSTTPEWDGNLNEALARWSQSPVLAATVSSANDAKNIRKRCPMVDGQMRVCNAAYGRNGWLGLATIGIDPNGHIDRGTAKMNDSYPSYWTPEEKNHVMCQEIGHVLGLSHTSEDGSSQQTCMDYSSDPASQWPNTHDYEQLAAIYGHTDSYNSYAVSATANSPACKPGNDCDVGADVPPMGVRVVRGPRYEIWVAARGDGGLWIHHIRLAPAELR